LLDGGWIWTQIRIRTNNYGSGPKKHTDSENCPKHEKNLSIELAITVADPDKERHKKKKEI
jgi:hypothetical protein